MLTMIGGRGQFRSVLGHIVPGHSHPVLIWKLLRIHSKFDAYVVKICHQRGIPKVVIKSCSPQIKTTIEKHFLKCVPVRIRWSYNLPSKLVHFGGRKEMPLAIMQGQWSWNKVITPYIQYLSTKRIPWPKKFAYYNSLPEGCSTHFIQSSESYSKETQ